MTKKYFDISGIKLDATGRVELPDSSLPTLVQEAGLAGGSNYGPCYLTDASDFCGAATNPACSNPNNCRGDTNTLSCSNGFQCSEAANGFTCTNDVSCQAGANFHTCTNTFVTGCAGSSNLTCN